jgi:hypothetical protein
MNILSGEWYADTYIILEYLTQLKLVTGNERSGTKIFNREKKSGKPESSLYGWTWRKNIGTTVREFDEEKNLYKTKLMADHPELLDLFKEFSNSYFPLFEWNNVQINFLPEGTSMKKHFDKKNVGESILVAFGSYKGGNTYVRNTKDKNYTIYDARVCPLQFNGAERDHGVNVVSNGDRYSLVFFNNNKNK